MLIRLNPHTHLHIQAVCVSLTTLISPLPLSTSNDVEQNTYQQN